MPLWSLFLRDSPPSPSTSWVAAILPCAHSTPGVFWALHCIVYTAQLLLSHSLLHCTASFTVLRCYFLMGCLFLFILSVFLFNRLSFPFYSICLSFSQLSFLFWSFFPFYNCLSFLYLSLSFGLPFSYPLFLISSSIICCLFFHVSLCNRTALFYILVSFFRWIYGTFFSLCLPFLSVSVPRRRCGGCVLQLCTSPHPTPPPFLCPPIRLVPFCDPPIRCQPVCDIRVWAIYGNRGGC